MKSDTTSPEALACEIEESDGLFCMGRDLPGYQLGIKKTAQIVAALRSPDVAATPSEPVTIGEIVEAKVLLDIMNGYLTVHARRDETFEIRGFDRTAEAIRQVALYNANNVHRRIGDTQSGFTSDAPGPAQAAVEVTPAMLEAGAQALVNDAWHPPQPISSISGTDARRYRRQALLVLKAALSTLASPDGQRCGVHSALESLAKISLWRDSYPDGPDIFSDPRLYRYFTPDQVRAARAALSLPVTAKRRETEHEPGCQSGDFGPCDCARSWAEPSPPVDLYAWPVGCLHPNSCNRHGECMYTGCSHTGKPIKTYAVPSADSRGGK